MKHYQKILVFITLCLLAVGIVWADMGDVFDYEYFPDRTKGFRLTADYNLIHTPISATGYSKILTGNLVVGDGTPDQTQDGEDAYVEGTFENDGGIYADGGITMGSDLSTDYKIKSTTINENYIDLYNTSGDTEWATSSGKDFIFIGGAAADLFHVSRGNIKVGQGTPSQSLNGDDIYISGTGETAGIFYPYGGIDTDAVIKSLTAPLNTLDFKDGSSNIAFTTSSGNDVTFTPGSATDIVNVLTGCFKVGNGSPDLTLSAEDTYFEGTLEVDEVARLDGGISSDEAWAAVTQTGNTLDMYSGGDVAFTVTGGNLTATFGNAGEYLNVVLGNLKVGNGAPDTTTLNGEDGYIEGTFENDGGIYADGGVTLPDNVSLTVGSGGSVTWDSTTSLMDFAGNENHAGTVEFDNAVRCDLTVAFNGHTTHADNIASIFGGSNDAIVVWDTTETNDSLEIGLGDSELLIIGKASTTGNDSGLSATTPTVAIGNDGYTKFTLLTFDRLTFGDNGEYIDNSVDDAFVFGNSTGTIATLGTDLTLAGDLLCVDGSFSGAVDIDGATIVDAFTADEAAIFNSTVALNGVTTLADNVSLTVGAGGSITWDTTTSLVDFTGNENHTGSVEFDGAVQCDSTVALTGLTTASAPMIFNDGVPLQFGTVPAHALIVWETTETNDCLEIGVGNTSMRLIVGQNSDIGGDSGLGNANNPTVTVADATYSAFGLLAYNKLTLVDGEVELGNAGNLIWSAGDSATKFTGTKLLLSGNFEAVDGIFSGTLDVQGGDITLPNDEVISNSTDEVIDLSSATYGVQLINFASNPEGVVTAPAGTVGTYSQGGNQYICKTSGSAAWWYVTMATMTGLP